MPKSYKVISVPLPPTSDSFEVRASRWEDFGRQVEAALNSVEEGDMIVSMQTFPSHGYQIVTRKESESVTDLNEEMRRALLELTESSSVQDVAGEIVEVFLESWDAAPQGGRAQMAAELADRHLRDMPVHDQKKVVSLLQQAKEQHAHCSSQCTVADAMELLSKVIELRIAKTIN